MANRKRTWKRHEPQDYMGRSFGQLRAVEYLGYRGGHHHWRCVCACGGTTLTTANNLTRGHSKSCGCLRERPGDPNKTFWPKIKGGEGCWEWQGPLTPQGYGMASYAGRHQLAHRMAYVLTVGPIPAGLWVLHDCDNRRCCRPSHLYVGTQQNNADDMVARERSAKGDRNGTRLHPETTCRGEKSPNAKLTVVEVCEVRRLSSAGLRTGLIAAKFGVCRETVRRILVGKAWHGQGVVAD